METEKSPFPILATERLLMRELCLADCHDFKEIFSSEKVMAYYGMFPVDNLEIVLQLIESLRSYYYEDRGIRWAILNRQTGQFMGTCGFHNCNNAARRAEIGYELHEDFWGHGYIKEAIEAMKGYGCSAMNLHRIEAMVYPENIGSIKALEALGFEKEGLLKGYAYFRNIYQDLLMFSWINPFHQRI